MIPARLDVARDEEIAAVVDTITRDDRGLYALINNTGVGTMTPATETRPEEFDLVMNVNVRAPYRLTQAFAPLLAAARGRVVTIGSVSGLFG